MQLDVENYDGTQVIRIGARRIDAAVAIEFKDGLRDAAAGGPPRVVLDMSAVEFLDSSGLGALVAVMKQLAPDQRVELAAPSPIVAKVLRLTRMDQVFRVHADAEIALRGITDAA